MRPSIWTALGLSATGLLASTVLLPGPIAAAPPASSAAGSSAASVPSGSAPGGPGTQAYLDSSRKDCFGTAQGTASKVWFTVADGVLSDVYSPTIENSDNGTLQYIVTNGSTFSDLQQRDMTYSVSSPDPSGMVCQVTSTDTRRSFQLVTDYITDPARDSVVMQTRLLPLHGNWASLAGLKVYARWDATIDNTGGGGSSNAGANSATIAPLTTALISSDTRAPRGPFAARVTGALVASKPFRSESSGFVGTPSDGLNQLDAHYRLVKEYRAATDGNVVQTAEINMTPGLPFSLALGFGPGAQAAIRAAIASATAPFRRTLAEYVNGWSRYDRTLRPPPASLPGLSPAADAQMRAMYWLSANTLKADEDKTHLGAFVASPTDPWGQSVPATTTHPGWTYREVFARDSYETFTGLLADGDTAERPGDGPFPVRRHAAARRQLPPRFAAQRGGCPRYLRAVRDRRGCLSAADGVGGRLGRGRFVLPGSRPALTADFIVDHGPAYGVERWEEHPGYSPSTIAAEIAGLVAASHLPGRRATPRGRPCTWPRLTTTSAT